MTQAKHVSGSYDVAVVGGGPAGSTAALALARQGVRVALFEKQGLPRYKPCGGGVTRRALRLVGIDVSDAVERRCREVILTLGPEHSSFVMRTEEPLLSMVMRDRFDMALLDEARRAGVGVFPECPVTDVHRDGEGLRIVTTRGEARFRFAVAADGAIGRFSRLAGWRETRRLAPTLEIELPVRGEQLRALGETACFDFGAVAGGYAWVFPKRSHLSVGVGVFRRNGPARLSERLRAYTRRLGLHPVQAVRPHGSVIPVSPRKDGFVRNRVMLVGDAAGLADPVTGEGIWAAVQSGLLAAEALIQSDCREGQVRMAYEAALRDRILGDLKIGRVLSSPVYAFPPLRNGLFALCGNRLSRAMAQVVCGRARYKSLFSSPRNYLRLISPKA